MPNNLTPRDVALYLSDCTDKEFAEVFAYYYESERFFEEEPNARVTEDDILNVNAHECGCSVRDRIVFGVMDIVDEKGEQ